MKILVTGGFGMVGQNIKGEDFFFHSRKDCDLTNRLEVLNFFKKHNFKYIIHLAASVGGLYKNLSSNIQMFSDNIKINENVLEACHLNNITRGVFCLSSCVYPAKPSRFPMDETMIHESPPHFSNEGYSYAKRMLELQTRQYNKTYGYEYICVTPVNLYGKHDNFSLTDGHFIPMVIHRFFKEDYTAYGTGKPYRQFLYAEDFAKIIVKILLEYKGPYRNIICCDDNEWTIKEVVEKISGIMKTPKIQWDTTKSDGCLKKTVTNKRLKEIFSDIEFTPFDKGLRETYNWFIKNYNFIRK
jgi:GDP-L-fucose synthase